MAEIWEFSVDVAAIGISGHRGDPANRRWYFLREGFFKKPSKGLFITNSFGSGLPPPVSLVVSSMFCRNLVAKLSVGLIEAFCPFVTQPTGEFAKAGGIVFPQCRQQQPSYLPGGTERSGWMPVWWKCGLDRLPICRVL
jgi:hypothetical protein